MAERINRDEIRSLLESRLSTLEARMGRIRSDRRREQGPLDADFEEQAVELENAPVLDALDAAGLKELETLRRALARIDQKEFGQCESCGDSISMDRLRAVPTTVVCRDCAS